jgi:hypothetical protein
MAGTYVYAIVPMRDEVVFEVAGVDDDHDGVYSFPHEDLAAVVSASPLADYRELKRDEAVRYLVAHQRVVEKVMQDFPVLPVKFGTVLPDKARVNNLLTQRETLFRTSLEQFAGRVQMEVVVSWNLQEVFQEIGIELRSSVPTFQHPNTTVEERIAVGRMVQACLEQRRVALRDGLLPSLQEVALDLVVHPLMDNSMVANVALLVDQAGRGALDRRLEQLDEELSGRLHWRCIGPLPPYSFATVEVQVPSFEAVDEAREQLGLGEAATLGEIKRAYHQLAGRLHPDHNPGDARAEARMAALAQAHELLTSYAQNSALQPGNTHPMVCYFDRLTVDRTLLVTIRRQEAL